MKTVKILLLILTAAVLLSLPVFSGEENIPSVFAQDEAWYKDAVYPLVVRDGIYFVPAELFSMIDGITVSIPREDNLLIHNTANDTYISVLFMKRSAAVNGEIIENISVLRNGDMYYIDAYPAAEALGLTTEVYTLDNGGIVLRIFDSNSVFSTQELVGMYTPKTEAVRDENPLPELPAESEDISYDGKLKKIYVLVKSPKYGEQTEFPALDNCRYYGIRFTHFLDSSATVPDMLSAGAMGLYGVVSWDENRLQSLNTLNTQFSDYTRRITCFTLSTGDASADEELRREGYIPIVPDFTVNGTSNPDTLLPTILQHIGTTGSCTLLLEDCWNSERMAILLSEMENSLYCTANLADYSFSETGN